MLYLYVKIEDINVLALIWSAIWAEKIDIESCFQYKENNLR